MPPRGRASTIVLGPACSTRRMPNWRPASLRSENSMIIGFNCMFQAEGARGPDGGGGWRPGVLALRFTGGGRPSDAPDPPRGVLSLLPLFKGGNSMKILAWALLGVA